MLAAAGRCTVGTWPGRRRPSMARWAGPRWALSEHDGALVTWRWPGRNARTEPLCSAGVCPRGVCGHGRTGSRWARCPAAPEECPWEWVNGRHARHAGMEMAGMDGSGMGGMAGGAGYGGGGYGDYGADCQRLDEPLLSRLASFSSCVRGNAEVAYAVPIDGTVIAGAGSPVVPLGAVRVADPDYAPGFRVGFGGRTRPAERVCGHLHAVRSRTRSTPSRWPGPARSSARSSRIRIRWWRRAMAWMTAAILQTEFELLDVDFKGLSC